MNLLWLLLIAVAFVVAAFTGRTSEMGNAALQSATDAVTLALGLVGGMALWLGLMRIAEKAGLVALLARAARPLFARLFPEVPPDHPAMSSILMNIAANMLGIGNAATPLGIKAMLELQSLNAKKDTASDAMVMFLAINTSSVTLIPATIIALRAKTGSADPAEIIGPGILATACSTAAGIAAALLLKRFFRKEEG